MSVRNYPGAPVNGVSTVGHALSGAATGVVLSYTAPAGRQAKVTGATLAAFTGAPNVQIRATIGGVTIVLTAGTAALSYSNPVYLAPGDVLDVNVAALVGGSSFDAGVYAEEYAVT